MKKLFLALLAVFSIALVVAGCGGDSKPAANSGDKKVVLKVGATPVPHAEILNLIKPQLAKEGVDLQIIEFSDYVKPNLSLADKELDANFFQHTPYLEKFASERNLPLVAYTKVHIEPMGVYSKKLKDLNNVPSGAKVAIPNDPTNGGRALALLQSAKLLKLRDGVGISGTPGDIVDNPKNPFTEKSINTKEKQQGACILINHREWNPSQFHNRYKPLDKDSDFWCVKEDIFKLENWSKPSQRDYGNLP